MRFSRREWFQMLAPASLLSAGSVTLSQSPKISVQDFAQYPKCLTPSKDFFVRSHFEPPEATDWRVRISGAASRHTSFTIADLRTRKRRAMTAVLECAGNGVGVGAVGCAEWSGPSLDEILADCGAAPEARFVRFTGADRGKEPDSGPDALPYARVIPMARIMSSGALLALEMNGEALPRDHGAPVRLLLPGSYGMNSVKWLREIELLEHRGDDFFMTHRFRRVSHDQVEGPVDQMQVKSIIVQPKPNAVLRGSAITTGGYAWGPEAIARVEVSVNDRAFRPAILLESETPNAWRAWRLESAPLPAGSHSLTARAFTVSGRRQPEGRDPQRQDEYELNHYHRVHFMLRP